MEHALLRDDAADQERDQQDDRHRAPADAVEVMHHRGETERARIAARRAAMRHDELAEHLHDRAGCRAPSASRRAATTSQRYRRGPSPAASAALRLDLLGFVDQVVVALRQADDVDAAARRSRSRAPAAPAARHRRCRGARPCAMLMATRPDRSATARPRRRPGLRDRRHSQPSTSPPPRVQAGRPALHAREQSLAHDPYAPHPTRGRGAARIAPPLRTAVPGCIVADKFRGCRAISNRLTRHETRRIALRLTRAASAWPIAGAFRHQPRREDAGRGRGRGTRRRQPSRPRRMRALCTLWRNRRQRGRRDRGDGTRAGGGTRPRRLATRDARRAPRATRSIAHFGISRPSAAAGRHTPWPASPPPQPLVTAYTISIGTPDAMAQAAQARRTPSAAEDQARRDGRSGAHRGGAQRRAGGGTDRRRQRGLDRRKSRRQSRGLRGRRRHAGRTAAARRRRRRAGDARARRSRFAPTKACMTRASLARLSANTTPSTSSSTRPAD